MHPELVLLESSQVNDSSPNKKKILKGFECKLVSSFLKNTSREGRKASPKLSSMVLALSGMFYVAFLC